MLTGKHTTGPRHPGAPGQRIACGEAARRLTVRREAESGTRRRGYRTERLGVYRRAERW